MYASYIIIVAIIIFMFALLTMEHGLRPERLKLVWRWQQLLSGFLAKGLLPRESPQSHLTANDMGDNMIPGAVHRSPGICHTTVENSEKPQLGDRLMKTERPVIASNAVPYLQIRSVGVACQEG